MCCYAECRYAGCRYAECHYAECHYVECRYAECRYAECCYAECCYAECRYAECRYAECRSSSQLALPINLKFLYFCLLASVKYYLIKLVKKIKRSSYRQQLTFYNILVIQFSKTIFHSNFLSN